MLVEDCLIIENKVVSDLDPIFFVIVRSYLKAVGKHDALLLNFAAMPLTIKRGGPDDTFRYRSKSDHLEQTELSQNSKTHKSQTIFLSF